jgi:hypothetical protein
MPPTSFETLWNGRISFSTQCEQRGPIVSSGECISAVYACQGTLVQLALKRRTKATWPICQSCLAGIAVRAVAFGPCALPFPVRRALPSRVNALSTVYVKATFSSQRCRRRPRTVHTQKTSLHLSGQNGTGPQKRLPRK